MATRSALTVGLSVLVVWVALLGISGMGLGDNADLEEVGKTRLFCKLNSKELRARIGEVRSELLEHVVEVDELEGGYRFWVARSEPNLRKLADFVKAESDCCAFFNFEISLRAGEERVSLSVSGAAEAKSLLEKMLLQAEFDLVGALTQGRN